MTTTSSASADLVTWSDRYSVGIPRIDAEHRKLFDLVNELYRAILDRRETAVTSMVLNELASHTVFHFIAEEGLMKRYSYPGYAPHKAEHEKLVAQVNQLKRDVRAGQPVSQEVMVILQHWLIGHILGMDQQYSAHLQAAGAR